jgi:hypothetical protein
MTRLLLVLFLTSAVGLFTTGCSSTCDQLATKVCDRAGEDVSACDSLSKDATAAESQRCQKMMTFAATCKTLTEEAKEATADDEAACKADLELIRALERAQM